MRHNLPNIVRTFLIVLLVTATNASAFEINSSRSAGLGHLVLLSRSTSGTLLGVASGGLDTGLISIEFATEKRFEISNLNNASFSSAYRFKSLTGAVGISQFGYRDLYAERILKGALSYNYKNYIIGFNLSGMMIDFGGTYGSLRGSAVGLSLGARTKHLFAALSADNLNKPELSESSLPLPAVYTINVEYLTGKTFSSMAAARFEKDQKKSFSFGQFFAISNRANLFWSFSTEPTLYGAGIEILHKQFSLSYATSIHPVLGFTHKIGMQINIGKSSKKKASPFE